MVKDIYKDEYEKEYVQLESQSKECMADLNRLSSFRI